MPGSANEGCSGQMPESRTPTSTPSPAVLDPPRDGHTFVAPTNRGEESVCSCSRVSLCTATTPSTARRSLALLAGSRTATPPKAVVNERPTFAAGTAFLMSWAAAATTAFACLV